MEYNSFYGGRQGAPFIIVKSFKLVDKPIFSGTPAEQEAQKLIYKELIKRDLEMETLPTDAQMNEWFDEYCMIPNFKKGDDYKTVNYDEYVIIDSVNKNDFDNGKIYQRGRDYLQDDGDAQYIGQIVGPAGVTPHTKMTTIATVQEKATEAEAATDGRTYRLTSGTYAPTVNLVPGANGTVNNRTFNTDTDSIQYAMVSVRDVDGHDAEIYVGFKFPYTIIDFYSTEVTQYINHVRSDTAAATRRDDGTHPYYEQWELKIPKGIKGDSGNSFRVIEANNTITDASGNPYPNRADDITNHRKILVYDYYHYDNDDRGEPLSIYLGDYNMITSITEQDGVVTINYSHDDSQELITIKYITSIAITTATGKMVVTYNTKDGNTYETDEWILPYVVSAALNPNGTFSYKVANGTASPTNIDQSTKLTWIENAQVLNSGEFQTKKNTSSSWDTLATLKYIDHTELTPTGNLNVYYNTDTSTAVLLGQLKWISNISGSAGYIDISYNNGDSNTLIWQGTQNSTGALVAEKTTPEPEPSFAEGSPWFVIEELPDEEVSI